MTGMLADIERAMDTAPGPVEGSPLMVPSDNYEPQRTSASWVYKTLKAAL